jgi:hypothetical protein
VPESALLVLYAALEKETAMGGAKIQTKLSTSIVSSQNKTFRLWIEILIRRREHGMIYRGPGFLAVI